MAPSPFILIPAAPSSSSPLTYSQSHSHQVKRSPEFKPPAHVHAHHIHSVKPSPVNTRTLILEQTLSHLVDTRLAAARAHLGLGGITSQLGPESVRHRHEFYNEFTRNTSSSNDVERDERLALRLHSKAKGISNVLCAMLAQEPAHGVSSRSHQRLPDDVRFRLVFAILLEHYFIISSHPSLSNEINQPEIPLQLAPFVSLSSYRASSPSAISRPSHPTLPPLKSLNLASASSSSGPQSPFAAFGATGVSPRPVKPLFLSAASSGLSISPSSSRPTILTSPISNSGSISEKEQAPVPVYKWPSQDRNPNSDSSGSRRAQFPKTMTTNFNWLSQSSNPAAERGKAITAAWSEGFSSGSASSSSSHHCTRHLLQKCQAYTCISSSSLPQNEKSTIGAGLDSRRSRLDIFSDSSEDEELGVRMLTFLSDFIRLSALISSSPPREEWYDLLALILTRVVLEGYMLHGWKGTKAVQILFGFGSQNPKLSPRQPAKKSEIDYDSEDEESDGEDGEEEFVPDGYLDLENSYSKLFSFSQPSVLQEYKDEMIRRRSEFLSPAEMPAGGLKEHLESLNVKYSADDLDKMLLNFFDCISLWKGASSLQRGRSEVTVNNTMLAPYFNVPVPSVMEVDKGGDDESQSETESDRLDRPSTPGSSKRPRAPSLASVPTSPIDMPPPPLKRERLGSIA